MATGFIILFGLTMLYLAATSRIIAHIRILIVQGFLLFLICCCGMEHNNWLNFAFLTVETLALFPFLWYGSKINCYSLVFI